MFGRAAITLGIDWPTFLVVHVSLLPRPTNDAQLTIGMDDTFDERTYPDPTIIMICRSTALAEV